MTYFADLDPNHPATERARLMDEAWDENMPEWRELSSDPEDRRYVDYSDVSNPDEGFVTRYGNDHGVYHEGAYGE